jgi:hypothetical protein
MTWVLIHDEFQLANEFLVKPLPIKIVFSFDMGVFLAHV